ncbi:t-SNARE [Dacryopinax primogenitus]|uniref:t-SNARE n=1 Tax=Dacryopinax primogenitus (strain DJM 731) TaxID=1858805 RepID=M5GGF4_DACPD|nr:t-SNARE [Dacryopinax primogenitus]EJU05393.1 t-SNARE [Dacryopinax primogenitus]
MSRDRLAAMRAQQGGYNNLDTPRNPYDQRDDTAYGQNYSQQSQGRFEMSSLAPSDRAPLASNVSGEDMTTFYAEISSLQDSIRTMENNVTRISDLHNRSLNNMDEAASARNTRDLNTLMSETTSLTSELKKRIKKQEGEAGRSGNAMVRRQQIAATKAKFIEVIQNYQAVEQQFRGKYKQRMERQFRIVKPEATPEEVRAVVDNDQGDQIFAQALMSSNRLGESRAAYREVQERHEDVKRIEKTLTELAQLFNDMSVMVEEQDESINVIQSHAYSTEKDMEIGLQQTEKAVVSARSARKKRWICFAIIVVILIVVAIIVVIEVKQNQK